MPRISDPDEFDGEEYALPIKTLPELLDQIAKWTGYAFTTGEDNDGQLVLYTDLHCTATGKLIKMEQYYEENARE